MKKCVCLPCGMLLLSVLLVSGCTKCPHCEGVGGATDAGTTAAGTTCAGSLDEESLGGVTTSSGYWEDVVPGTTGGSRPSFERRADSSHGELLKTRRALRDALPKLQRSMARIQRDVAQLQEDLAQIQGLINELESD